MSRFICGLETELEGAIEKAYICESRIPVVLTRYTPDSVQSKENVYLITKLEKNGSRIIVTPGVIVFAMFARVKEGNGDEKAREVTALFLGYFTGKIKGSRADGNDVLINDKKVMGLSVLYNPQGRMLVRFVMTMKADKASAFAGRGDFDGRKYQGIAGVCDKTGMSEKDARSMVREFVNFVLKWRDEDAAE